MGGSGCCNIWDRILDIVLLRLRNRGEKDVNLLTKVSWMVKNMFFKMLPSLFLCEIWKVKNVSLAMKRWWSNWEDSQHTEMIATLTRPNRIKILRVWKRLWKTGALAQICLTVSIPWTITHQALYMQILQVRVLD